MDLPNNKNNNNDLDDVWDLSVDDAAGEREMAAQTLRHLERSFHNSGYRYGVDATKNDHMQEGFDEGMELAMDRGKLVGGLLGQLLAQRSICKMPNQDKVDEELSGKLDAMIMRLRATKYKTAVDSQYFSTSNSDNEKDENIPTSLKKLIGDATELLASLQQPQR